MFIYFECSKNVRDLQPHFLVHFIPTGLWWSCYADKHTLFQTVGISCYLNI